MADLTLVIQPRVAQVIKLQPLVTEVIKLPGQQGPAGPKGDSGAIAAISVDEVPSGLLDGINRIFTVLHPAAQMTVSLNGIVQSPGLANDFTFAGNAITFTAANTPRPGDVILATYTY